MNHRAYLKTAFVNLSLSEVLRAEPSVLLGVTSEANALLASLRMKSVYDLALCAQFGTAARIVAAAEDGESVAASHGAFPAEAVDAAVADEPIAELPLQPVGIVLGLKAHATAIANILSVDSVRDLALWPPYVVAKRLVREAFVEQEASAADAEAPPDLVPSTGQFATQRVSYTTTVLIESRAPRAVQWNGARIDLSRLDRIGFSDVGFGAVLTFSQQWTPKRVALGHLLHSVPLAPGESTNLTIVDWTRRVRASTTEEASQTERLSNALSQATAISEVTHAVAEEHQDGFSASAAVSASISGSAVGVPVIPTPFGVLPLPVLGSASASSESSGAATYTTSSGERSIATDSQQRISARTRQQSAQSRTRRAAIVSEVSENERETLTTRRVTNHNHMHALSIQYYEVVQIYETELKLARIERCLFIPMRLVNLRNESNIRKYLPILIRRAVDRETRDRLLQFRHSVIVRFSLDRFGVDLLRTQKQLIERRLEEIRSIVQGCTLTLPDSRVPLGLDELHERRTRLENLEREVHTLRQLVLASNQAAARQDFLEKFDASDQATFSLDRNLEVRGVHWAEGAGIRQVTFSLKSGETVIVSRPGDPATGTPPAGAAPSILLHQIVSLRVTLQAPAAATAEPKAFSLKLLLQRRTRQVWFDASFVASQAATGELPLLQVHPPVDVEDLADRLMDHQLHYSQHIWRRADRQSLLMQLAPLEFDLGGRKIRVVDFLDPAPVSVAGNYLAFRFTYEADAEWQAWKAREQEKARPDVDLVPLPTGGVFAEAVLGELNSAEKLDATRFWKWEDSPIPIEAGAIADAVAGRQIRISPQSVSGLSAPLLRLQEAPQLPPLSSTSALTNALMSAKLFNDMSGREVTAQLLKASQEAAKSGNLAAQKQAEDALGQIFDALGAAVGTFSANGPEIVKTLTDLGGVMGLSAGGAEGAAAAGAAGASGASVGEVAATLGPIVAQLAPLLLI